MKKSICPQPPIEKAGGKKNKNKESLLNLLVRNSIKEELKALLSMKFNNKYEWRGIMAVPPGSILSDTIQVFKQETDIPLEIPFFTVLSFISAYLTKKQVKIISHMGKIRADIWNIVLAPSGSAKSAVVNNIKDIIGEDVIIMPKSASAAQFVIDLRDFNNGLLIRDEYAQHLKAIQEQTYMAEQAEYYLLAYDGATIERRTKQQQIVVLNPCITILGFNVDTTFMDNLTAEYILDGSAQRYSYVIAKADPARKIEDYPDYDIEKIRTAFSKSWAELKNIKIHNKYTISENGIQAFRDGFKELYKIDIPNSYYRRALFKSIKYALLYHIILKKENSIIDEQDMEWALRVVYMHLRDGKELLSEKDMSELEKVIRHAEELDKKFSKNGKSLTARDLISYDRRISSIQIARAILEIIKKPSKMSAKKIGKNIPPHQTVVSIAG